jgi:putative ABC transport system permease protein
VARGRTGLWLRWSARQLRQRWVLVGAIALIIAVGTGTYAGIGGTSAWRTASNDASFAVLRMHDVRASLPEGRFLPAGQLEAAARAIANADRLAAVEERLVVPTLVDASTADATVLTPGRIVGTPPASGIDLVHLTAGRAPGDTDGAAVLETKYARARHLPATGTVRISGDREVPYRGTGYSPEYFLVLGDGAQWSPDGEYAVLFMRLDAAQRATGHTGEVNGIVVRLVDGLAPDDRTAVIDELRTALGGVGATVTVREDEFGYRTMYEDADNDQQFWNLFALLILAGASLAAFNLISRMVEAERREIGVGMALGTPTRLLAMRHLLVAVEIAFVGTVLGVVVGWLLGLAMRSVLTTFVPLPVWLTPFPVGRYVEAALLGLLVPVVATVVPVWRAVRVEPVDALRTGPMSVSGSHSRRRGRNRTGSSLARMPVRNLARSKRRSLLTALGIAAAITSLVGVLGMLDSMLGALHDADRELRHEAPDRLTVSLSTVHAVDDPELRALMSADGVARAEAGLRVPVTLSSAGTSFDAFLQVLPVDAVWTPTIESGTASGLVISWKAADDLGVAPGDSLAVRHPRATATGVELVEEQVIVTGTHANPLRIFAFLPEADAAAFGLAGYVNTIVLEPSAGSSPDALRRTVFAVPGVAGVEEPGALGRQLEDQMGQITGILRILEFLVLGLALVIAFNSAAISSDERAREHATMFAFGVPTHRVLTMMTAESVVTGLLGTLIGLGGGYLAVRWMVHALVSQTLPELGIAVVINPSTIVTTLVLGVVAVALAPWFTARRLRRMDIPATLRVLE